MGETTRQIEAHIEATRKDLGANLQEVENKVKSATDWRLHFHARPIAMLGLAFGCGALLALMVGRKRGANDW